MDTNIDLITEALRLAELGYAVFPCRDPRNDDSPVGKKGKKPLTGKGVKDATTDLAKITRWWKKWPTANIGLACKNCLVLDLDNKDGKNGSSDMEAICQVLGRPDPISVAATGSGGWHLFFAKPDIEISGQTTAKWQGQVTGIDIRVGNQYVIVAPSLHESGQRYSWDKPLVVPEQLAPLPQIWVDDFLPHKNPVQSIVVAPPTVPVTNDLLRRAEQYLDAVDPAIQGQNGSGKLYWAVTTMLWKFGLDEATTKRLIIERYNHRCEPPWTEKEIDHKISDAKAKPPHLLANWEAEKKTDLIRLNAADVSGIVAQARAMTNTPQEPPVNVPENRFVVLTCAELMKADLTINFLIENVLVEGQPMIVGGAKKTLKTSIMLDMAVSLSSGVPFLRRFAVPARKKVLIMSGESGLPTIRDTIVRISTEAGVDPNENEQLFICDTLPRLDVPGHITQLRECLEACQPDVAVFDPAYLMIDGEKAENVMVMGRQLSQITQLCLDYDSTLIIAHHYSKGRSETKRMPDLNDLSQSGFAEFARQWILLGRQEEYVPGTGNHTLNMVIGGSVGHQGSYIVYVSEGIFPNRIWKTTVNDPEELGQAVIADGLSKREAAHEERRQKVLDLLEDQPDGLAKRSIRDNTGISDDALRKVLDQLVESGTVEQLKKGNGVRYRFGRPRSGGRMILSTSRRFDFHLRPGGVDGIGRGSLKAPSHSCPPAAGGLVRW